MHKYKVVTLMALLFALPAGCAWVKPTPEGEFVRVMTADAVVDCERKGKVTVSLRDRVAGFDRKASKVAKELTTLARNEGALLGGDTVVAETSVTEGRQVFGVFKCQP
jgi:hypothetical protein